MATWTYEIPGVSCAHCQAAIEAKVSDVSGVTSVTVDVDARGATVTGSSDLDAVTAAIEQAGYEVTGVTEQTATG